jgi:hypothetical protein
MIEWIKKLFASEAPAEPPPNRVLDPVEQLEAESQELGRRIDELRARRAEIRAQRDEMLEERLTGVVVVQGRTIDVKAGN